MGLQIINQSTRPVEWVKGKVIGSGSFGSVHLAMDKSNGSLFVIKSTESGPGLKYLENEANILENVNSKHIVKSMGTELSDMPNDGKRLNLFMEYMAGGSLSDVAEKFGGALDEKVIKLYTREILYGLNYLHKNNIVHSDLKCKNVLLGSSGDVKLADFGCAKRINTINSSIRPEASLIGGTPLWMAPEVLRNERLDFAADIWSLGCTVIEMATGKLPWGDRISNPMVGMLMIACGNELPNFPANFSDEGVDFLRKCLQRKPELRWTSYELLNHPFVSPENKLEKSRIESVYSGKKSIKTYSPASVLDVGNIYDFQESPVESVLIHKNPYFGIEDSEKMDIRKGRNVISSSSLMNSGSWVTVR